MSAASYHDLTLFKAEIGDDGSAQDSLYTNWAEEASRVVDRICREPDGAFSAQTLTKTFDVTDANTLYVPALQSITSLKTDEDGDRTYEITWASTDYRLYPLDGPPYNRIERDTVNGDYSFPLGAARVQIVGSWGESATVPPDIQRATHLLMNRYRVRPNTPEGVMEGSENLMRLAAHDADFMGILLDGRRIRGRGHFG